MALHGYTRLSRIVDELTTPRGVARSIVFVLGYILSPASWWNDAFVNIPLAYLIALLVSRLFPKAGFPYLFGGAYLVTNILGMIMMHFSVKPPSKKTLIIDLAVSVAYTIAIIALSSIILG